MQPRAELTLCLEIEREILSQPAFAGGTLTFSRKVSARHSHLLEYEFGSSEVRKSIIIKRQFAGPWAERATLSEYSNLKRLKEILEPPLAQTIPEPLLAIPKSGLLVTSKVDGDPLTNVLKKYANRLAGPFRTSRLRGPAQRVGDWLRNFQSATRAEPVAFSIEAFLADLEFRLAKLQQKGFTAAVTRDILQSASQGSAGFDGKFVPAAAKHGDFIPQNILVERAGVGVVDFEGFTEREPVYEDLGMFLGYLLVLGARVPYSPRALNAARDGFLAGYVGDYTIDQALLSAFTLKGAVRILSDGVSFSKHWSRVGNIWMLSTRLKQLVGSSSV